MILYINKSNAIVILIIILNKNANKPFLISDLDLIYEFHYDDDS